MKKALAFVIIILVLGGCGQTAVSTSVPSLPTLSSQEQITTAQNVVDDLSHGNASAVYALCNATVQNAVTENQLNQIWLQLELQYGNYQKQGDPVTTTIQGYQAVVVRLEFSNGSVDFRLVFDADGKIGGINLLPVETSGPTATTVPYVSPTYSNTGNFTEVDVTVGSAEWALPGTLSLPKGNGPFPAVVLVHGSGPNDRDETIGPNKPFRDIAWGLASQGIAVLRYDKRTLVHAALFTPEVLKTLTLQGETIDDALLAVQLLRTNPKIDANQIYVLGHSLGAIAAPRIGQQDPSLAGLIIMAGATRPLEDIIIEQLKYTFGLKGSMTDAEKTYLQQQETAAALVKSPSLTVDTPADQLPLGGASGAYWLDLRGYNPAELAKTLNMRLLVLQGGRDYQVTPDNLDGWRTALSGKSNATLKLYPDLNHLFISGSGASTPEEYNQPGHVSGEVIQDIVNWVLEK